MVDPTPPLRPPEGRDQGPKEQVIRMKVLFVYESNGEIMTCSRDVSDSKPETLRSVMEDDGFESDEVKEIFIIEGELTSLGGEYLDEEDEEDEEEG